VVAGNFINVAPPTDTCLRNGSFTSFQAVMTTRRGVVVTQGFSYYFPGAPTFSPSSAGDPFVRLFVPPFVASGQYLVYLSCNNYLLSYSFSGTSLTVSPAIG